MVPPSKHLPRLRRIRWAVRAALLLGVAASVAANVLHALPNIVSQVISAWPPLALLLTVELTSRIPMHRRSLAAVRVVATVAIAGIAAWVSYWHMQDVARKYGETDISAYLLPISVDGLIVVASVSLVELAGRIRFLEEPTGQPAPPVTTATAPPPPVPAAVAPLPSVPVLEIVPAPVEIEPVPAPEPDPITEPTVERERPRRPAKAPASKRQPSTADQVARAVARSPRASNATIAARLGLSEATVQRHRRQQAVDSVSTPAPTGGQSIEGHDAADEALV